MNLRDCLLFTPHGYVAGAFFKGKNWIYPPQFDIKSGRIRGGIPLCFPFGKNAYQLHSMDPSMKKLERHGPFRNLLMDKVVLYQSKLQFEQTFNFSDNSDVQIVRIIQEYEVYEDGFEHRVEVHAHEGNVRLKPIKCNLGLHPYFITPTRSEWSFISAGNNDVSCSNFDLLTGTQIEIDDTVESKIYIHDLGRVTLRTKGFSILQIWSDSKNYICVEPVQMNWSDFSVPDKEELLYPGSKQEFSCRYIFD